MEYNTCIVCGEKTDAPACWGCYDEAVSQGLIQIPEFGNEEAEEVTEE